MANKKISPPDEHKADAVARRVVRGLAGTLPVAGSIASEVIDGFMPDPAAADRRRWEGEVTSGVNNLGTRVDDIDERMVGKKETISGLPAAVLAYMLSSCPNGLALQFTPVADLAAQFPDQSEQALKEAMADLESYHLVERRKSLNGPGQFRLTEFAYEQVDHQVLGFNTQDDAKELMQLVGSTEGGVRARDLQEMTGWTTRRLNPALRVVLRQIAHGRVSKERQADYVASSFRPSDAERAATRRLSRS